MGDRMDRKPLMTRSQLGAHLRANGIPVSDSSLNKACMPTVNDGPPVECWWGRRPLYDPDKGLAWAQARTRPVRGPSVPAAALDVNDPAGTPPLRSAIA